MRRYPRLFVLTGAGISTASGIPGYRDADGRWTRAPPVYFHEFLHSESARRRYWSRSLAGWPLLAGASPNAAHVALARLEALGYVRQLVTQNVDGLHQCAGSATTIELHGSAHRVTCLACGTEFSRASVQRALELANAGWLGVLGRSAPDGDAELDRDGIAPFRVPPCARCGGTLKPDIVFFGESVPSERVAAARNALEQADAMLVAGSSLMVRSGYRFCEWAAAKGQPIAAINLGRTRADPLLAMKIEARCADVLAALADGLGAAGRPRAATTLRPSAQ